MCEISPQLDGFLLATVSTVVGTLLGFFLFVLWEIYKGRREADAEKKRILNLLVAEIKEDMSICAGLVDLLGKDLIALDRKEEIATTPTTLEVEGWSIGKSSSILKILGWEGTRTVAQCYATARRINLNIQSRETMRITARAWKLEAHIGLIKMCDQTIMSQAMQYVREAQDALEVLGEEKVLTSMIIQ